MYSWGGEIFQYKEGGRITEGGGDSSIQSEEEKSREGREISVPTGVMYSRGGEIF